MDMEESLLAMQMCMFSLDQGRLPVCVFQRGRLRRVYELQKIKKKSSAVLLLVMVLLEPCSK